MCVIEQEFADDACQFVKWMAAFCLEFDEGEQQVVDHGGPNLRHNGIFRGAEEGFDFKILFDPLEEDFNLPSWPVELCDVGGIEVEVVSHEGDSFTGLRIGNGLLQPWSLDGFRLLLPCLRISILYYKSLLSG